jgi:predicted aldo/keto reductase-like oxidoreductase
MNEPQPIVSISATMAGINLIDTADVYSQGRSEEILGKLLVRIACKELAAPNRSSVVPDLRWHPT